MKNKRFSGFDIYKALLTWMVIEIHTGILGDGGIIRSISNIAVPSYMMISGFYYRKTINSGESNRQIKKIAKYYAVSCLFYATYLIIHNATRGIPPLEYVLSNLTWTNTICFLLFNYHPLTGVLWYFGSLLYTLIAVKYISSKTDISYFYKTIPLLIIINILCGRYALMLFGKTIPFFIVRNWLFNGFPLFLIGMFLSDNKDRILTVPIEKYVIAIIAMTIFVVTEHLCGKYEIIKFDVGDLYIFTVLLAIPVFCFFYVFYQNKKPNLFEKAAEKIGRYCSLYMYVLHMPVKTVLDEVINGQITEKIYHVFAPFIIYFLTLLAAILLSNINRMSKAK